MSAKAAAPPEPEPEPEREAAPAITSARVLAIAVPVVLSNATVPIQGAIDTAMIGNLGQAAALAAVGLGAEVFGLLFGVFNFLQIGSSGLAAQALGRKDPQRVAHTLIRGLGLAGLIASLLILFQVPLAYASLALFEASAEAEAMTAAYFHWRIWGAPAELANYALVGWFAGQEMTRRLFQHQVVLAAANVLLNLWLVLGLGWGVEGVALGTAVASYLGIVYGLWLARARVGQILPPAWRPKLERLLDRAEIVRLMALNRDVFIRTLLLIGAFAWTARLGSLQGDVVLAANVVLFQFLQVSAYGLDGFAIAAESLVGQSMGSRDPKALDRAAWLTSLWAGALAAAAALTFALAAPSIIDLFTTAPEVRETARLYMYWAALIPLIGFLPFQFDGIFVGATGSREMRDAMIMTSLVFFPGSWLLMQEYGNHGLWAALWIWMALRAMTLAAFYPRIRRRAAGLE